MKNSSRINAAMALAVMSSAMAFDPVGYQVANNMMRMPRVTPRNRYPEQSKRQANRRYRRAQGGPGLDANNDPRN
jgi:hypothetical protein